MLNVWRRAVSDMLAVQFHRSVTVFAAKLGYPIAQRVGDRRGHPLPPFLAVAAKELLHFALVDFLTHIRSQFLQAVFGSKSRFIAPAITSRERINSRL
jgi:hypothetical protein